MQLHDINTSNRHRKPDPEKDQCLLLGPLSLTIQLFMGIIVVGTLLAKRSKEKPKRKMKVWVFDMSKQVLGSLSVHFLNLMISILKTSNEEWMSISGGMRVCSSSTSIMKAFDTSPEDGEEDQCYWYFLNLFSDCTIGIPILWAILALSEHVLIKKLKFQNLESGNYYNSVTKKGPMFSAFCKQFLIFFHGILWMKFLIFLILLYFEPIMQFFADLVLGWTNKTKNLKIFFVMFVIPIVLNCFQYYCIDNIIKIDVHGRSSDESGQHGLTNHDYFKQNFEEPNSPPKARTGLANADSQITYDSISDIERQS